MNEQDPKMLKPTDISGGKAEASVISDERLGQLAADARGDGRPSDWSPMNSEERCMAIIELQSRRSQDGREAVIEECAAICERHMEREQAKIKEALGAEDYGQAQWHDGAAGEAARLSILIRALSPSSQGGREAGE